jgi:hypothetical protein
MSLLLRRTAIRVFCAYIVSVIASLWLYGQYDDSPYFDYVRAHSDFELLRAIWNLLQLGELAALISVLVGGVPVVYHIWRRSPDLRHFFFVPIFAFIAISIPPGVVIGIALTQQGNSGTVPESLTQIITVIYGLLFLGAAYISVRAVVKAILHSAIDIELLRFTRLASVAAMLAMALMTACIIAWAIIAHVQFPQHFDDLNLIAGYPTIGSMLTIGGAMFLATLSALIEVIRAFASDESTQVIHV